jgi:MYXO-CTERM domain-containing protein
MRTLAWIVVAVMASVWAFGAGSAEADVTVLTFEGLGDNEAVEQYYNGGTGGDGSGPGPDYGIYFSDNALAIIDSDAGGTGNFGGEPSPDTVMYFLSGAAATMNVPDGFETGFSFFYSAINQPGQIVVYDGLDATGNVLATLDLPVTPAFGAPDPTGAFSPLVPIGVAFDGVAESVDFGGTINQIGFDNITLGSEQPGGGDVPVAEPTALGLVGLALMGLRRRRG